MLLCEVNRPYSRACANVKNLTDLRITIAWWSEAKSVVESEKSHGMHHI